jgi:hypothetical protein
VDVHAQLRVQEVLGLEGVSADSVCDLVVRYRPTETSDSCQANLGCGDVVLYGGRPTDGYLDCEVEAGDSARLTAADTATHEVDGDPALTIDSAAGTLEIHDTDGADHRAFSLRARFRGLPAP